MFPRSSRALRLPQVGKTTGATFTSTLRFAATLCFAATSFCSPALAAVTKPDPLQAQVDAVIKPLLESEQVPGLALAVITPGQTRFYTYGLADTAANKAVDTDTLFELGSVSKTFTGVLAGDAIARGEVRLTDPVSQHLPALNQPQWRDIRLLHLISYTAGGLPLQIPADVKTEAQLLQFFQQWQPEWAPGQMRRYANSSIGLFGQLALKPSGLSFTEAMQQRLLRPLGLQHTYMGVPKSAEKHYAWGYRDGKPTRVGQGALWAEAYGVTSNIKDMALWVQAQLQPAAVAPKSLQQGLQLALQPTAKAGPLYQGLGWDLFDLPAEPAALDAVFDTVLAPDFGKATAATLLNPATSAANTSATHKLYVHKTGATNGFSSYAAFIPAKGTGIVLLANKSFSIQARVKAAYQILQQLPANPAPASASLSDTGHAAGTAADKSAGNTAADTAASTATAAALPQ